MSGAQKNDKEKIQLELLSPIWLLGVGAVLTFGARKYAAHNWRQGLQTSRLLGACLRHVLAFLGGEDLDPETGLCHLDHASCCLMFARELWQTRPELDDRYKPGPAASEIVKARAALPVNLHDPVLWQSDACQCFKCCVERHHRDTKNPKPPGETL